MYRTSAETEIGIGDAVEKFWINPSALSFEVNDFRLEDKDDQPHLGHRGDPEFDCSKAIRAAVIVLAHRSRRPCAGKYGARCAMTFAELRKEFSCISDLSGVL